MSDRPDDRRADDAGRAPGDGDQARSEEAQRRTDGDRWQASVDSWSGGVTQPPEESTREIRLDGGATPAPAPTDWAQSATWEQSSWQQPVGQPAPPSSSWEQSAQQPTSEPPAWERPPDDRSWEQTQQDQIASWQQPPSWQQDAAAERGAAAPSTGAATGAASNGAASWRPADQPPPAWEPSAQWPSPDQSAPAAPQAQQQVPQQQAWEPPPGARPWEQQNGARHQSGNAPVQQDQQTAPPSPQDGRSPHGQPGQQGQHGQQAPQGQQNWGQQQPSSGGWGSQGSTSSGWQPQGQPGPQPAGRPPSLTSQSLLRQTGDTPTRGWRKFVHKASGGTYNPGLSPAEVEHRALVARVTTPVRGSNRIAVVSLKGGIGKTTTTCCLGLTLAHHRGDRVVALDANPDAGTLAERLTNVTDVTVRDLLAAVGDIRSFTDVSAFTSLAGRLQVLASDQDPALSEAFSEEEYRSVADVLARYFNIILTDSGTGLLHSAMSGTLAIADSLVVVGAPSVDGASRASKTLDWLIAHGHEELVSRSVAVISSVRPNTGDVDMDMVRDHFAARCRAVVEIPYDQHLVTGGLIDLERVGVPARTAFLELSAHVADGFAMPPLTRKPAA